MNGEQEHAPSSAGSRRVLITGASGFVGRELAAVLVASGMVVRGAVRVPDTAATLPAGVEPVVVGDLDRQPDWSGALKGVDVVVHLAGRAHVLNDSKDALAAYRRTNVEGTRALVAACAAHGVRRFVLVSSLGVLGRSSPAPLGAHSPVAPVDLYAVSKAEAEAALRDMADAAGLEWVIVRPPLVYGPGNPGNFLRLLNIVARGIPLPFGAVRNRRSMVSVFNLCDLLRVCVAHPRASGEVFMVSDGEDWSTPRLIRELGAGLGRPVRLPPVPVVLLRAAGWLTGRGRDVERLCDSLTVDIARTRELLEWTPPVPAAEGIRRTAAWYRDGHHGN